jgi:hypothetical protein
MIAWGVIVIFVIPSGAVLKLCLTEIWQNSGINNSIFVDEARKLSHIFLRESSK